MFFISMIVFSSFLCLIFMFPQPEEGSWCLEDLTSVIKLDLSKAEKSHLFYTEGCQVVVAGEMINGVFVVQCITFPPLEEREKTLTSLGVNDVFGLSQRPQHLEIMKNLEASSAEQIVVILSEIHLDKPIVSVICLLSASSNTCVF
jgi:hypothetical protein